MIEVQKFLKNLFRGMNFLLTSPSQITRQLTIVEIIQYIILQSNILSKVIFIVYNIIIDDFHPRGEDTKDISWKVKIFII